MAMAVAGACQLATSPIQAQTLATDLDPLQAATARTPRSQQLAEMAARQAVTALQGSRGESRYSLEQLILQAIESHPSIGAKRSELNAAQSDVESSRWQFYPTPGVNTQRLDGRSSTTVSLQQPLWTAGRLSYGLAAAESRAQSAEIAISEQQYQLAIRLVSSWQNWHQAVGRSEALSRSVTLLRGYVDMVRRRIDGGASARVDLDLVNSRLAQALSDLAIAQAAERVSLSALRQLVGMPLAADMLARPTPGADLPLPAQAELLQTALARHPTLLRLEADLETAGNEISQRRAALFPTVSLRAEHQAGRLYPNSVLDENRVLVVMDYSPGAGLSAKTAIEAAEGRANALRDNMEATRRDLSERINSDYEEYAAALARLEQSRLSSRATAEVLNSYDRLFIAGKRNWLDVLNAARELTQTELLNADLDAQVFAAAYRLRLHGRQLNWQAN